MSEKWKTLLGAKVLEPEQNSALARGLDTIQRLLRIDGPNGLGLKSAELDGYPCWESIGCVAEFTNIFVPTAFGSFILSLDVCPGLTIVIQSVELVSV